MLKSLRFSTLSFCRLFLIAMIYLFGFMKLLIAVRRNATIRALLTQEYCSKWVIRRITENIVYNYCKNQKKYKVVARMRHCWDFKIALSNYECRHCRKQWNIVSLVNIEVLHICCIQLVFYLSKTTWLFVCSNTIISNKGQSPIAFCKVIGRKKEIITAQEICISEKNPNSYLTSFRSNFGKCFVVFHEFVLMEIFLKVLRRQ